MYTGLYFGGVIALDQFFSLDVKVCTHKTKSNLFYSHILVRNCKVIKIQNSYLTSRIRKPFRGAMIQRGSLFLFNLTYGKNALSSSRMDHVQKVRTLIFKVLVSFVS